MDRCPDKLPNSSSRFIAMAVSLTGSSEAVRAAMQCSEERFLQYCDGAEEPTWQELCRLIELVVAEQRKMIARNRDRDDRIPDFGAEVPDLDARDYRDAIVSHRKAEHGRGLEGDVDAELGHGIPLRAGASPDDPA